MNRNEFVKETFGLSYEKGVLELVDVNKFIFYTRPFHYEEGIYEILIAGNIIKLEKFAAKLNWLNDRKFTVTEIGENYVLTHNNAVFFTEEPKLVAYILENYALERNWVENLADKNILLPIIKATIIKIIENKGDNICVEIPYIDYIYGCHQKRTRFSKPFHFHKFSMKKRKEGKMSKYIAADLIGYDKKVFAVKLLGEEYLLLPADDGRFYLPKDEKIEILDEKPESSIIDYVEVEENDSGYFVVKTDNFKVIKKNIKTIIFELASCGLLLTPQRIKTFDGEKIKEIKVKLILKNGKVYINNDKIPFITKIKTELFGNPFEYSYED